MHTIRTSRRALMVLPAIALLISACGDSTEATVTTSPTETTTPTGDSGATTTVADTGDGLTSGYLGSYELMDDAYGTMVTVTVDGDVRTIETNALPDHETGEFPNDGNPNTISAQNLTWEFPTEGTFTGNATEVRVTGVAVNGVKFEPGTAETISCDTGETHRVEAIQDVVDLGLDFNNAHVQPTGEYHYHGISQMLVAAYESGDDLVHIGFAADGYLIYYSKSGAYQSGYALGAEARTGTGCAISLPGSETFDLEGTTPDGAYDSDWVFDEANGDLDSCNGTTIDGEYVYLVTDTYPFIGRCVNGEAAASVLGGPGGGPGPP